MSTIANSYSEKIETAWSLRYREPLRTYESGQELIRIGNETKDERALAYGKLLTGVSNFLRSHNEHILEYLIDALKYFEGVNDQTGTVRSLIFLTNVSDNTGDLAKGLGYGKRGLKLVEELQDKEAESDLLGTLGLIYSRMADYESAIESFMKSLALREAIGNIQAMASSLNLIARTYAQKGDYDRSLEFYKRGLKIREDNKDYGALPWTYLGMASLFEKMNDDETATIHYQKGMELNKSSGDKRSRLYCLWGMGKIETRKKNGDEALTYLKEALEICTSLNFKPVEYEIHFSLAEAYELKANHGKALEHFKSFHKIKEEVLSAETANKLKNQEISFAIEKSEAEAEIHRLRNVELKAAFDLVEEKNQHITNTIRYAKRIQGAILPLTEEVLAHLPSSFIYFEPKDIVSGDFYWFAHAQNRALIASVDCTGHGVPGAFMSMIGNSLLNQSVHINGFVSPADVLNQLHRSVKIALKQTGQSTEFGGETRDGMDIALCSFLTEKNESGVDKKILEYAGANRPLLLFRKKELIEIKADKFAIGGSDLDKPRVFTNHIVELEPGDTIYIFSDGIVDQFNSENKKLTMVRMRTLLLSVLDLPMEKQKEAISLFIKEWKGETEQTDDMLMIGVRV